jgi:hypothetical protein
MTPEERVEKCEKLCHDLSASLRQSRRFRHAVMRFHRDRGLDKYALQDFQKIIAECEKMDWADPIHQGLEDDIRLMLGLHGRTPGNL